MGYSSPRSQRGECTTTAYQQIGVAAEITVTPTVECGPLSVTCVESKLCSGDEHMEMARRGRHGQAVCRTILFQELRVALPVTFGAEVACELRSVHCVPGAKPSIGLISGEEEDSSGGDWTEASDDCENDHSHGKSGSGSHGESDSDSDDESSSGSEDESGSGSDGE